MTMPSIEALEARVARIEGIIEELRARLASIENRLDRLEDRVSAVQSSLEARMQTQFQWMMGVTLSMWATVILAILIRG
jgi:uncharacterized coiled-coil protein SlyX